MRAQKASTPPLVAPPPVPFPGFRPILSLTAANLSADEQATAAEKLRVHYENKKADRKFRLNAQNKIELYSLILNIWKATAAVPPPDTPGTVTVKSRNALETAIDVEEKAFQAYNDALDKQGAESTYKEMTEVQLKQWQKNPEKAYNDALNEYKRTTIINRDTERSAGGITSLVEKGLARVYDYNEQRQAAFKSALLERLKADKELAKYQGEHQEDFERVVSFVLKHSELQNLTPLQMFMTFLKHKEQQKTDDRIQKEAAAAVLMSAAETREKTREKAYKKLIEDLLEKVKTAAKAGKDMRPMLPELEMMARLVPSNRAIQEALKTTEVAVLAANEADEAKAKVEAEIEKKRITDETTAQAVADWKRANPTPVAPHGRSMSPRRWRFGRRSSK